MAGKVGVSENEYSQISTTLESVQESFISEIDNIKNKISEINCQGGGFYTDHVTPNISRVVAALTEIQNSIKEIHSSENSIIKDFQSAIENIDTCC